MRRTVSLELSTDEMHDIVLDGLLHRGIVSPAKAAKAKVKSVHKREPSQFERGPTTFTVSYEEDV
jgi:hypothetical protein